RPAAMTGLLTCAAYGLQNPGQIRPLHASRLMRVAHEVVEIPAPAPAHRHARKVHTHDSQQIRSVVPASLMIPMMGYAISGRPHRYERASEPGAVKIGGCQISSYTPEIAVPARGCGMVRWVASPGDGLFVCVRAVRLSLSPCDASTTKTSR